MYVMEEETEKENRKLNMPLQNKVCRIKCLLEILPMQRIIYNRKKNGFIIEKNDIWLVLSSIMI
jgi:hypothetical protein